MSPAMKHSALSDFLTAVRKSDKRRLWVRLGVTSLPLLSTAAWGAEWRVEPQFEAGARANSNVALSPEATDDSRVESISGDIGLVAELATPRSDSLIRPRLRYESFLDRSDLDRLEGFLDFKSEIRSLRSTFDIAGDFSRQNELTAELPDAEFSEINPDPLTTPETGDIRVGETRDLYTLRPEYSYRLTERVSLGGALLYQVIDYSNNDDSSSVDYDYTMATLSSTVRVGPRTDLTAGGFVGRYDARTIDSESDSVGATLKLAQRLSDRFQFGISASYQQIDITQRAPSSFEPVTATASVEAPPNPFLPFLLPFLPRDRDDDRGRDRDRDSDRERDRDPMPRPDPTPAPSPEPAPLTPSAPAPVTPMTPPPTPVTPLAPQPTLPDPTPAPAPPMPDPLDAAPSLQARAITQTNDAYGVELNAEYRSTVSRWSLRLGRQVTPTGSGGLSNLDQIRLQYDRALSERSSFTTAARVFRNRAVSDLTTGTNNDRDYARASVALNFMVTPTWYVSTGYDYTWQERERESRSASNNTFSIAFGYRGFARPR